MAKNTTFSYTIECIFLNFLTDLFEEEFQRIDNIINNSFKIVSIYNYQKQQ
jgi:hypothetical protein